MLVATEELDHPTLTELGKTMIAAGRFSEAELYTRQAIALNDRDGEAWFRAGQILYELQRWPVIIISEAMFSSKALQHIQLMDGRHSIVETRITRFCFFHLHFVRAKRWRQNPAGASELHRNQWPRWYGQ